MNIVRMISSRYKKLHNLSRLAVWLGILTMAAYYITAVFAFVIAPYTIYSSAMTVYRGCLEAAPASLASGICAGLLGDLILPKREGGDKP